MIPLCLRLSGFLSYRDPVELDFTTFDLACISGPNGAGKSTLLDAITWVLFGQARKRDESLINLQSKAAEVSLTFRYESTVYRVLRSVVRGKTPMLEFQVQQPLASPDQGTPGQNGTVLWKPLTERTLRDTQARIEQTLRLDYDTFVNASFFLQGKADQFAQQTPSRRKEVLGSILGLEAWETYRMRAADARRALEEEVAAIDGRRLEIAAELAEEIPRRQRMAELEAQIERLSGARKAQEAAVESIRAAAATLKQEQTFVDSRAAELERLRSQILTLKGRLAERQAARVADAEQTLRATEIESAYASWQKSRHDLEQWETVASAFRAQDQSRAPLVAMIAAEKARLEEELRSLLAEQREIDDQAASIRNLESELQSLRASLAEAEARVSDRARLEAELAGSREKQATLKAENEGLKREMDDIKARLETLKSTVGATCPLCGQPLSAQHRRSTVKSLQAEGTQRGNRFRLNKSSLEGMSATVVHLESQLERLAPADAERLERSAAVGQFTERLQTLHRLAKSWNTTGLKRLKVVQSKLERGKYALDEQRRLAQLNRELARLGYDTAAHDRARQLELGLRSADETYRNLQSAMAALAPLENEIQNLTDEIANRTAEAAVQEADLERARAHLDAAARSAPDLNEAERSLFASKEQENRLNQELGAARQKVSVLDDLRARDLEYETSRQSLALQIGRGRLLERAFGKDGVPALLIEQALPEIESRANELLDRLSDGRMSVHFVTQAGYKDRKREDLRETLEIQISDDAGIRDYEMYSGGEAFRINFAVRLALSEVLAARKGARLQTLVIDEGFGSQDTEGRQRLIEAINLIRHDFALVLVITHLEELKDAFPTRIEIEKTDAGSRARID